MSNNGFDELCNDPVYRERKVKEKEIYDLLTRAQQERAHYEALEREYTDCLHEYARENRKREARLTLSPDAAKQRLKGKQDAALQWRAAVEKQEELLARNQLRRRLGEYDRVDARNRGRIIGEELATARKELTLAEDAVSLLRRIVNRVEKMEGPRDRLEAPREEVPERNDAIAPEPLPTMAPLSPGKTFERAPASPGQSKKEATPLTDPKKGKIDFSADKTVIISLDKIGSEPERLLEPALHVQSNAGWERFPLLKNEISIGNIRNPENDIALYDSQVSRRHGRVIRDSVTDAWFYVDGGSTNGSTLNGKQVEQKTPVKLKTNDSLQVGETKITVYLP